LSSSIDDTTRESATYRFRGDHRYTSVMHPPPTLRLFVAMYLPEPVRVDLVRAAAPLRAELPKVRWVRSDMLHLTLAFLGERPADQVEAITGALDAACKVQAPFMLSLGGNGCFPSAERARVLWTGLVGNVTALTALQHAVVTALAAAQLVDEHERFSPHLTIGRLRDDTSRAERAEIGRRWLSLAPLPAALLPVEDIHLMRSVLTSDGPHYSILQSIALARCT
jgi:RNA 2',3'-cyclic 3'-phosphodiesterase